MQDHDLYLAGFAGSWCLRMLLERVPNVAAIAEQALGAPISSGDVAAVRLLLDAGADPTRYRDADGVPAAVIPEALAEDAPTDVIERLLSQDAYAARDRHGFGVTGLSVGSSGALAGACRHPSLEVVRRCSR